MTFTWRNPAGEDGPAFDGVIPALLDAVRVHTGETQGWALAVITWDHSMKERGWSLHEVRNA